MELLMYLFEVLVGDMRINLRGGDVAMTEHTLNRAEICTVHEKISGKAMP